jgi:alkaline phosphatase
MLQKFIALSFCLISVLAQAQPGQEPSITGPVRYSVANAHSHNDYENPIPFLTAYHEAFGSIEADVFLVHDTLFIAHSEDELKRHRTLDDYYLRPLNQFVLDNGGYPYKDSARHLQMLIEAKTEAVPTINKLIAMLRHYPALIHGTKVSWVITGHRPDPHTFIQYPSFIQFDGDLGHVMDPAKAYSTQALSKIAMLSADLKDYSKWNGKSNIPASERRLLDSVIAKAHSLGKPVRFWDSPDEINAWYQLMHRGVDYLNTDHITALAAFLNGLPATTYTSVVPYAPYAPTYASDATAAPAQKVILLIGDGTGLAQLYAGYTANHGALNLFAIKKIGLSKTSSADSYVTDSAPGSTSIASGVKTNNRYVGVDPEGQAIALLPEILAPQGIRSGLITAGDVTDATPADFFAHRASRDSAYAIFQDFAASPVTLLMGSGNPAYGSSLASEMKGHGVTVTSTLDSTGATGNATTITGGAPGNGTQLTITGGAAVNARWLVMQPQAGLSMLNGRGDWLEQAFTKASGILDGVFAPVNAGAGSAPTRWFLMAEGAQVDYGGHKNDLAYVTTEVLDFDQLVGAALRYADKDGHTLVIVTADHETGGLSLLDGDLKKGYVSGQFSTHDHSGIPVPVFAYGPGSQYFEGVYENTALFHKMLQAYGLKDPQPPYGTKDPQQP